MAGRSPDSVEMRTPAIASAMTHVAFLAAAILKMQETERLVLDPARKAGFDFAAFAAAWEAFEKART